MYSVTDIGLLILIYHSSLIVKGDKYGTIFIYSDINTIDIIWILRQWYT